MALNKVDKQKPLLKQKVERVENLLPALDRATETDF